jgi:Regulator of Chromosome Condensation (RCC1) repeat protein
VLLPVLLVLTMAAGVLGGCTATTRAGGGDRTLPTAVNAPQVDPATLRFVKLSTRNSHVCAITAEGIAYCWGGNYAGQLGTGARRGGGAVAGDLAFSWTIKVA